MERAELAAVQEHLAKKGALELWQSAYVAPLVLTAREAQHPLPIFELTVGMVVYFWPGRNGPQILYYRTRDHLRRMGIGRLGLEALWREDCKVDISPLAWKPEGSDMDGFDRLWRELKAAVPDHWITCGEQALDEFERVSRESPEKAREALGLAGASYDRVLEQQPENEEAIRGLARMLVRYGRLSLLDGGQSRPRRRAPLESERASSAYVKYHEEAIRVLQEAGERNPNAWLVFYNLGCYWWQLYRFGRANADERASVCLQRAFSLFPGAREEATADCDLEGFFDHQATLHVLLASS